MDPGPEDRPRALRTRHWWWRACRALVLDELDHLRPGGPWGRVLHVGCGSGALFDPLLARARHVEGLEPDATLVDPESPHAARIRVRRFDTTFRPAGGSFDLVLMLHVLERMERRIEALSHTRRLLRPGGVLVATVAALPLLWTGRDELSGRRLRYTRTTLSAQAGMADLRVRTLRYFDTWAVPAKLARRALEALPGIGGSRPRTPPAPLNALLEGVARLDHALGRQLHLPFGGSLLMVAEPGGGGR